MKTIYVLRTNGTGHIPDYLQVRDENFVLLTHSRADKPLAAIEAAGLIDFTDSLLPILETLDFGTITKIEL